MLRCCLSVLVVLFLAAAPVLCEGETTSTVVGNDSTTESHPGAEPLERTLSREERVRLHKEKIEGIINQNRAKREDAMRASEAAQEFPPRPPEPTSGKLAQGWRGTNLVTQKMLEGTESWTEAEEWKALIESTTATVSLAFSGAAIERVLDSIEKQSGLSTVARGKCGGQQVSLLVQHENPGKALQRLVGQKPDWLLYRRGDVGQLELWDWASFRAEVLPRQVVRRVFDVRNIPLGEAYTAVLRMLTPNIGDAVQIQSNRKLVVADLPVVLKDVEALLREIDVKPAP